MVNLFNPAKTVNLRLEGLDGNAFALMGAFSKQAKREGWSKEEIDIVLNECRTSDYYHLLVTLSDHCNEDESEEDCDSDWWNER